MRADTRKICLVTGSHYIYHCDVCHQRFHPIKRIFKNTQSLFGLDLDCLSELNNFGSWIAYNRRALVSFYERDHKIFEDNLKQQILDFLNISREKHEQLQVLLLTNLRNLGYVFNPLSIYLVFDRESQTMLNQVFEVGNTFGEQKLFAGFDEKENEKYITRFQKNYYISPFIALDSWLTVKVSWRSAQSFFIEVQSQEQKGLTLTASISGVGQALSKKTLRSSIKKHLFNSFKIIIAIHLQALIIYLRKIPFIRKNENQKQQQGYLK